MPQSEPPSPPPSSDGFVQPTTFMSPARITSHPRGAMSPEQGFVGYPYPSRYSTPVREDDLSVYEPSTVYTHKSDISFTGYAGGHNYTSHPYGPLPDEAGYNAHVPYTPEASPPTPCPTGDSITTRSGLSIPKKSYPMGRSQAVKTGRIQKRSKVDKVKNASSILSKPLSEIAKDVPHVPVADIAAFVGRSTEDRLSETSRNKKPGQIKRPMNAFMLYRKAYQDVAKTQCAQNNHQHVSKVCGAGWPLEPPQVRQMFDGWAKVERINHQQAHPGYKFTPSKPRKTRRDEDDVDGFSDNDSDWNGHSGPRKSRTRHVSRLSETPSINYETVGNVADEPSMAAYHGMHAYPTPGQTHAVPYGTAEPNPYDLNMRQYGGLGPAHGMVSRTPSPGNDYALHGLDGFSSSYYTPPEPVFDNAGAPPMFGEAGYDVYSGLPGDASFGHDNWVPHMGAAEQDIGFMMAGYEDTTAQDAYLRGKQEDWKVEEIDDSSQFDHWITQTEQGLM